MMIMIIIIIVIIRLVYESKINEECISQYQSLSEKCIQLKANETSQNKKIQKLKQRLQSQLEVNKCLKEKLDSKGNEIQNMDTKLVEFKQEFMNELTCASNFMLQLQSHCQTLSEQLEAKKEKEEIQNKKTEVLSNKTDIISQTQDYISKSTKAIVQQQGELNKKMEIIQKNQDSFAKCSTRLETLEKEMKKLNEISETKHKHVEQTNDVRNNGTDTLDKVVKKINTLEAQLITITKVSARVESLENEIMKLNGISEMKQIHGQQTLQMKKVKKESLDQAIGLSDVKCFEDSQLNIGHHEQQISTLGEADLVRHLANCEKNPGHANFIPIKTFSIKHLPLVHQNTDMYAFIKAASNLTVRINVTKTSQYRPKCWPNTEVPYFLNDMRGRDCLRTGSGMVVKVSKSNEISYIDQWNVTVQTATSVVFDLLEAKCTSLRFFYDAEDSPEVVLNYVDCSIYHDVNKDTCFIDFKTYDKQLAAKLQSLVKWYDTLYQKVNKTANCDDFMFIVSHPHGCSKQISLGQRLDRHTSKPSSDKITYLTSTCPGSSGAIVHCIGYINMNHTGCLQSGENYCSYRGSFYRSD
ncbi:uncharacterized protein LOC106068247 isoform X3 [Biomphalaria glabrata]|uniref:Uncharacterized protein LOC106068247 isoform X3 n=1 Tax=Biomphalaria glabrata TaxID=6526 RepID=A0A9W3BC00_BIOGL|nr:uncharacterized protein LOC106068247 isoform X3 [Biomphalaria glabrata]